MMKKIIVLTLTFICMSFISLNAFADTSASISFVDNANLYSTSEIEHLKKLQGDLTYETGWNIAVITTDKGFSRLSEANNYCNNYYVNTFGNSTSGVVYVIDLDIRYIYAHNVASEYLTERRLNQILDKTEERYFDYDDVGNLETFYSEISYYYNLGLPQPIESLPLNRILFSLIIGVIAAAISICVILHAYKKHTPPTTKNYLNTNTFNMYLKKDNFVREYTTRTRINSNSSGGRSSGSRSSGSGRSGRR